MRTTLESDVRRLVREVITEVLSQVGPPDALAQRHAVSIDNDADLSEFVDRVLGIASDPNELARYRAGKLRFVWTPAIETQRGQLIGRADGTSTNAESDVPQPASPPLSTLHVDKGAVTERLVAQALAEGSRIVLGKGAVVTPLAREFARKNDIPLEREQ
jgi:hypothetical protein